MMFGRPYVASMTYGRMIYGALALITGLVMGSVVMANEVKVVDAEVTSGAGGTYRFSVTLRHDDNGWDHYADRWQVLAPDGRVLATRVLLHPHDAEQPFTRGMSGVVIPDGIKWVYIRGHDKVHGDGPELFKVNLPNR